MKEAYPFAPESCFHVGQLRVSYPFILFFPLSGVRCCLQLFHRLIWHSSPPSSVSCLLLPFFLLSCLPHIHSPPISALSSLVSSCPAHVTLPLSSVVCHPPSFLHVLPTVVCASPVSLSSSSALPSLPLTPPFFACLPSLLLLFFGPSCFRTLAAFDVVVRSEPRFPFRTGMPVWHKCSWPCPSVFIRSAGPPSPPQLLSDVLIARRTEYFIPLLHTFTTGLQHM